MPYSSITDLPEAVRKRYSARCQAVFMRAFNATDGDEATRFKFAHTAAGNCTDSGKADSLGKEALVSTPAKASTNDTRQGLEEALRSVFGNTCYVQDFDPDEGWVIYMRSGENVPTGFFRLGFELASDGAVTLDSGQPLEVEQHTSYVPKRAMAATAETGASAMAPAKAAELDPDEQDAWWAGKIPRRLLAIPFSGPIPSPDGKGRDLDVEYFDEETDIKPSWFEERPVDWHHGKDPTGVMNGVLVGKGKNLTQVEDGWWVDLWLTAGEKRLSLIRKLAEKGAQLFGSSYAYPNLVRRGKAGHIDVWPYMLQTLSTSPQNTHSVMRPAKAVLDAFDQADIAISDRVLRRMLAALDDLRDLPATAANGRLDPARDLLDRAAKAGRELSGRNLAEIDEWLEVLDSIATRARGLRDRVRSKYQPPNQET
jgi:hypothetical protein